MNVTIPIRSAREASIKNVSLCCAQQRTQFPILIENEGKDGNFHPVSSIKILDRCLLKIAPIMHSAILIIVGIFPILPTGQEIASQAIRIRKSNIFPLLTRCELNGYIFWNILYAPYSVKWDKEDPRVFPRIFIVRTMYYINT